MDQGNTGDQKAGDLATLIDRVHRALRGVDAADLSAPLRRKEIDEVSDAVEAVEAFARQNGIRLSEWVR